MPGADAKQPRAHSADPRAPGREAEQISALDPIFGAGEPAMSRQRRTGQPGHRWACRAASLVVAIALLAIACGSDPPGSPSEPPPTAWELLAARHNDEGLTRDLALDAFASLIAPIRGGQPAEADDLGTTSATPAIRWITGVWDQLDADQRNAFREYAQVDVQPAKCRRPVEQLPRRETQELIGNMVQDVAKEFEGDPRSLGTALPVTLPDIDLRFACTSIHPDEPKSTKTVLAWALAMTRDDSGRLNTTSGFPEVCRVVITPQGAKDFETDPGEFTVTVAHELFHCHQFTIVGGRAVINGPKWVVEGSAEWAGERYANRVPENAATIRWQKYLHAPQKSLFKRDYDALGFYAHLENEGADPVATIGQMLQRSSPKAFSTAVMATGDGFLERWAAGLVRDPVEAPLWELSGPGLANEHPERDVEIVDDRLALAAGTEPRRYTTRGPAAVWRVATQVGGDVELIEVAMAGHGAIRFDGPRLGINELLTYPSNTSTWYCVKNGGCACPDGMAPMDRLIDRPNATGFTLAFTGGLKQGAVTVRPTSLKKACAEKDLAISTQTDPKVICAKLATVAPTALGDRKWTRSEREIDIDDIAKLRSCTLIMTSRVDIGQGIDIHPSLTLTWFAGSDTLNLGLCRSPRAKQIKPDGCILTDQPDAITVSAGNGIELEYFHFGKHPADISRRLVNLIHSVFRNS